MYIITRVTLKTFHMKQLKRFGGSSSYIKRLKRLQFLQCTACSVSFSYLAVDTWMDMLTIQIVTIYSTNYC